MPPFDCFIETLDRPVTAADAVWSARLPASRHAAAGASPAPAADAPTVGDYFAAVRAYLQGPGEKALARALAAAGMPAGPDTELRLLLSKHGAYYHPCRVMADSGGRRAEMVLNVAVSEAGLALAPKEFAILKRLNRLPGPSFLPEVYGFGRAAAGPCAEACMFLGQWLGGFNEFHLTGRGPGGQPTLVIWDPEEGLLEPDPDQCDQIYAQAARILTRYFDLETFECIGAWHHAAGDFVVRLGGPRPELRLVTVREYRPMFTRPRPPGRPGGDVQTLLESLLVFFMNLSVRMRLDRLDGVGELAWSGPGAVAATLAGVLEALSEKPPVAGLPLPLDQLFRRYLRAADPSELRELCTAVLTANPPRPTLADARLEEHLAALERAVSNL